MAKKLYEKEELKGFLSAQEAREEIAEKRDTDPSSIDLLSCCREKKNGGWVTIVTYIA